MHIESLSTATYSLLVKNFRLILVYVSCLIIGLGFISNSVTAEIIDKIVAVLDEELILLSEVRERMERPVVRILANLDGAADIEQESLQYIIEERLLQREIQYLASPKDKELSTSLATQYIIEKYYKNDTQRFTQQLQEHSITATELEDGLILYLKGIDYIRRKYRFNANIDDSEVVLNLFRKWIKDLNARAKIQPVK